MRLSSSSVELVIFDAVPFACLLPHMRRLLNVVEGMLKHPFNREQPGQALFRFKW